MSRQICIEPPRSVRNLTCVMIVTPVETGTFQMYALLKTLHPGVAKKVRYL